LIRQEITPFEVAIGLARSQAVDKSELKFDSQALLLLAGDIATAFRFVSGIMYSCPTVIQFRFIWLR